jgi:hypothetical protein
MRSAPLVVRPSLGVLTGLTLFFALILANGYALNLLNLPASPLAIFLLLAAELVLLAKYTRSQHIRLAGDALELAGFLLVVVFVWAYFLLPSLPTLLPPSYSGDAANHLGFADTIFSTGQIISDYPGGAALIDATLSHWIGWLPIRLMHPLASFWVALSAGAVYILACAMLPSGRTNKIVALAAPTALFFIWNYFVGVLVGVNYFLTQVAAQFFLVAFVCFLDEYEESAHLFWLGAMGLCLIGISVSFPLWLALPGALAAWSLVRENLKDEARSALGASVVLFGIPALFWIGLVFFGQRFIPNLERVRSGGVTVDPSLGALGGPFLFLPALGILLARGASYRVGSALTLLIFVSLQTAALYIAGPTLAVSSYWMDKSLSLWIFPLALVSVIPIHRILSAAVLKRAALVPRYAAFLLPFCAIVCSALVWSLYPPPAFSPLVETDIEAALWAKTHLDTSEVDFVGTKSLAAHWFMRMWGEKLPDDLLMDYPALGPKTFQAWRDDPAWGIYLLISAAQRFNLDVGESVVFQTGGSAIVQRDDPERPSGTQVPLAHFGDFLALADYAMPQQTFRPNDVISVTMQVKTLQVPQHQIVWRIQLRDLQNVPAAEVRRDPFDNKFPFHRWSPDRLVSQTLKLPIGDSVRAGLYDLQIGLYEVKSGEPISFISLDGGSDDVLHLGRVKILPPPVTSHELASTMRTNAKFGSAVELLGYRAKNVSKLRPGDPLALDLYWQSHTATRDDYTVFVHLLDASGALIVQKDSAPRDGNYPTSIWDAEEIVVDSYALTIPPDARPGPYRVEVGVYSWPSLKRLDVSNERGAPIGDHLVLDQSVSVK